MVVWWEQVYITLSIYGQGIWSLLPDYGSDAFDLARNTLTALVDLLVGVAIVIMYLPMRFFGVALDLLNIIIGALAGMINAVISLGNSLQVLVTGTFINVFPYPWVVAIGIIILLNIVLRVYFYAKDIHIFGWGI